MSKVFKKQKARTLRKNGASIRNIALKLGVSKGSISTWCRDISLSVAQIKLLSAKQRTASIRALLKAANKKRVDKIILVKRLLRDGARDVGYVDKRDRYIAGLALYWGEGYKKGNDEFGFTNSDPQIIKFIVQWLKEIYDIPKQSLILRVSVNKTHELRVDKIVEHWSGIVGVNKNQFTKTSLVKTKTKKTYENFENHFGTLRIKVRRSTNLRRRILGSLFALGGSTQ